MLTLERGAYAHYLRTQGIKITAAERRRGVETTRLVHQVGLLLYHHLLLFKSLFACLSPSCSPVYMLTIAPGHCDGSVKLRPSI